MTYGWFIRSKFRLRTQHPSASRIRTYARRRSVDRCLHASVRRDVRCCHDALVRGGHRAFMDGHTLHHASEGLVTSRCYFWIQCWCNGGLADSATATFDFSCCPRCLDGRLHAAATLHRSTALRDGHDCGCSLLVTGALVVLLLADRHMDRADFSGDDVARCMHRYEVSSSRPDAHAQHAESAESATHTHTCSAWGWASALWLGYNNTFSETD